MRGRRAFGTVYTRAPRPGYYVAFHWQGRLHKRAAGPTRKIAEQKLAAVHATLEGGTPIGEVLAVVFGDPRGARLTFREAAPLYLEYAEPRKKPSTFHADVVRLRRILEAAWVGNYLSAIRPEEITRWAEERRHAASGPTVNRDLALVSALYRWAIRLGYAEENPVRRVERYSERGRERETYLTAEEARALVETAGERLRPLLVCALSTGMRRGELLALDWRDVDWRREELVVRPGNEKAGRGRVVPMTDALVAELRALRAGSNVRPLNAGPEPVFTLQDGLRMTAAGLRKLFDSAVARCPAIPEDKKPRVSFHTLRHTAASLMVQAGVSLPEVGKILGHSTLAVTMRYSHFAPEAGRRAVDRLGQALGLGVAKQAEGG